MHLLSADRRTPGHINNTISDSNSNGNRNRNDENSTDRTSNDKTGTPGLHNKIPAHKIFARGWVAQKSFCS